MKKLIYSAILTLLLCIVGCREEKTPAEKVEERMEKTGESLEDAAEEVGDDMEDAAEEVEDAIEDATDDN